MNALLEAEEISVAYPATGGRGGRVTALDRVSFAVAAGRTLGIVGESGSGKSSLARALVGLEPLAHGGLRLDGRTVATAGRRHGGAARHGLQFVFQDPVASLDPRMRLGDSIAEPIDCQPRSLAPGARRQRVAELLAAVGLDPEVATRFPHQLSGGQCQRVAIARALAARPRLLVCDEPVSALDASVQGQVLNLLLELQRRLGIAIVLISHDLAVVRHLSDEVLVLYRGQAVELAPADQLFTRPQHPYSQQLLAAATAFAGSPAG